MPRLGGFGLAGEVAQVPFAVRLSSLDRGKMTFKLVVDGEAVS